MDKERIHFIESGASAESDKFTEQDYNQATNEVTKNKEKVGRILCEEVMKNGHQEEFHMN